jgi:O-methyltransferase involved in polyketide biosynthesis
MASIEKYTPALDGVPETLLWPLWNRAAEQRVKEPLIQDPMAAALVEKIDYDFAASFGKPNASHAVRSRVFDDAARAWLQTHPERTIVSLGEGLDTQFWRIDNGKMRWLSVDLEESIRIRTELLPGHERMQTLICSAFDRAWMEHVPEQEPVFIIMAGLLMYFEEQEIFSLLCDIAERFPSASEFIFDAIPPWLAAKSMKGDGWKVTKSYVAPHLPWGMKYKDADAIANLHPALRVKRKLTYADPFPKRMRPYSWLSKISRIRDTIAPWMLHMEIAK